MIATGLMVFFLTLAFVCLVAIAVYLLWQDWQFFRVERIHTMGKVVGHQTRRDDGSTYYKARVQFIDALGRQHEFVDSFGKNTPPAETNTDLHVVYPIGAPQLARVKRPLVRLAIYLFIFGAPALVLLKYYGYF